MHVADHLTTDQLVALADAASSKRRFLRIRAVILAAGGRTAPEVASALGCSRRAAQAWVARYNDEGASGFDERPRPGRPPFLDAEAAERLRARLDAGPTDADAACTLRGPEVRTIPGREFGVLYSMPAVYALLHRLGYSCLDPRPRHRKAEPAAAEAFQRKVAGLIDGIARDRPDKRIEVWFEDEARLGQKGTLTTVWARRGSRPTAVRQTQYDYLWVIAAACPATGAAAGIVMPHLDTPTINVFLEQFSAGLAPDAHAVLIWDGAGFHTSGDLVVPGNVSLIRRPPYSPELNPIENLWHYLRSHYWSNRVYEDREALKEAACSAPVAVATDAGRIKSVCAAPYLDRRESA